MKILYLYAEVMGYTMASIQALSDQGAEIHVIHWDHKKLTPYKAPEWPNVHMYERSKMNVHDIVKLAEELDPDITVVSGWQDKDYLVVSKKLRKQGGIVVVGFDDQWHATSRQYLASLLGKFGYFSKFFSHAWVSGAFQYEYARRIGFEKQQIIYDLYSADLNLFEQAYKSSFEKKKNQYPHRFLFVGRFEAVKGLDTLLEAWRLIGDKREDWELHLIGNGSMKSQLESTPGVIIKDFMQPEFLLDEVANAGCFVLPSNSEPWGVVVHEFVAAGMPVIVSDVVGAASTFLISGTNGYSFKVNDPKALANCMKRIIAAPSEALLSMADISNKLAYRITPQTSANNLLSLA